VAITCLIPKAVFDCFFHGHSDAFTTINNVIPTHQWRPRPIGTLETGARSDKGRHRAERRLFAAAADDAVAARRGSGTTWCTRPGALDLVHSVLRQPVKVVVGEKNAATYTVEQSLVVCGREDGKLVALRQMVREGLRPPVLIFMLSVEQAMQLFHALVYDGLRVDVLHAEHTAAQREATVSKFRAGQVLTRGRARARPRKHTAHGKCERESAQQ